VDKTPFAILSQRIFPSLAQKPDVVCVHERIHRSRPLIRELPIVRLDGAQVLHRTKLHLEFSFAFRLGFQIGQGDRNGNQQERGKYHQ
jgi:hypothetical protein